MLQLKKSLITFFQADSQCDAQSRGQERLGEIHNLFGICRDFDLARRRIEFSICHLLDQILVGKLNKFEFQSRGIADSLPEAGSKATPCAIWIFECIRWLFVDAHAQRGFLFSTLQKGKGAKQEQQQKCAPQLPSHLADSDSATAGHWPRRMRDPGKLTMKRHTIFSRFSISHVSGFIFPGTS